MMETPLNYGVMTNKYSKKNKFECKDSPLFIKFNEILNKETDLNEKQYQIETFSQKKWIYLFILKPPVTTPRF